MGRKKLDAPGFVKVCVSLDAAIYDAARAQATSAGVPFSAFLSTALKGALDKSGAGARAARIARLERITAQFQSAADKLAQEVDALDD